MRKWLPYLFCCALPAAPPANFAAHEIAGDLRGGYQVVAADLNHDGRIDVIALASGMSDLVWFENPGWERHVIRGDLKGMINLAAWDLDGDGIPEIALASGFSMRAADSPGVVSILRHAGDPRGAWSMREIDRLPTTHRLRWADIDGSGRKVLINAPLTGASAQAPESHGNTPLVLYRPGEWKRELIGEQNEGVTHGIFVVDWDGHGREDILTASFSGIHLFRYGRDRSWSRTEITRGSPAPWPKCGSSDVAVGRANGRRFVCAIEPWHGNEVVVYTEDRGAWRRAVIDDSLAEGHTILAADLNRDGSDEIVAGYRGKGASVQVYSAGRGAWSKRVIDGAIPANACAVADLNGDRRPDLVCIGGEKLKWYENTGAGSGTK